MSKTRPAAETAETIAIDQLRPDPRQIRTHTDRNLTMIGDGLRAVGAARSIVLDEQNVILAGNGTIEAARRNGFSKVRVVEADGTEIIAVRRRGLTEKAKVELALYDNRSADFAEYDAAALTKITELLGIDPEAFFSAAEHAELLEEPRGHAGSLADRFVVPPFTVLDARQGYWQDRKAAWKAIGIGTEARRSGNALPIDPDDLSDAYRIREGKKAQKRKEKK
jgi:ParB-like chromosome segregation protein Spo0J